ncbi:hypothetical protein FRB93_012545 [Tulasnella sp. JGI-2019a]|nr:hypothetical protein FRB93_012545 [Tulasnella sp. JGI-2019a]
MIARRTDHLLPTSTSGPALMSPKDQRTSKLLACFAIFLLRMYESSLVLAWVKNLQRTGNDRNNDEMDIEQAALLYKWVASRQEWLLRSWTARLQLSTTALVLGASAATSTTAADDSTTPRTFSLAIPKMRGRTLTWESTTGESDEGSSSSSSAGATIEAYTSEDEDESDDTDATEETEVPPPQCISAYTDKSLTRIETTADIATVTDDSPGLQGKASASYQTLSHEIETQTDDSDVIVILASSCSSVPTILLTPAPAPSSDEETYAWDMVQTPTQYTMWGSQLVVPGFRCYDDENVRPGVWQKWAEEDEEHDHADIDEEDVDISGTDADSEVDDDERTWTYHTGSCNVEEYHSSLQKTAQVLKVDDADVKKTFWIDEDEEDLPDIPLDWA